MLILWTPRTHALGPVFLLEDLFLPQGDLYLLTWPVLTVALLCAPQTVRLWLLDLTKFKQHLSPSQTFPTLNLIPFVEASENNGFLSFRVSLSHALAVPVSFNWRTEDPDGGTDPFAVATAGVDYTSVSLTNVTIPAGDTFAILRVSVTGRCCFRG